MTEILLLGSFHFLETPLDIYSPEIQAELGKLTASLARFRPDAVAVECAAHQQDVLDESYRKFALADLSDPEKMRRDSLGTVTMFGQTHPITYNNEAIQIGYRLGKMLGLERIFAIDDDSELDGPMERVSDRIAPILEKMAALTGPAEQAGDISGLFRALNGAEWSRYNQQIYLEINRFTENGEYPGAEMTAQWYRRNLKIFANIQNLAERYGRILVVYGAGHLHILRQLIRDAEGLTLADAEEYLR